MKTSNRKPLGAWLTASLLFLAGIVGLVSAPRASAPVKGLAAFEHASRFVLDEDLDVKIFVHQNRPV